MHAVTIIEVGHFARVKPEPAIERCGLAERRIDESWLVTLKANLHLLRPLGLVVRWIFRRSCPVYFTNKWSGALVEGMMQHQLVSRKPVPRGKPAAISPTPLGRSSLPQR